VSASDDGYTVENHFSTKGTMKTAIPKSSTPATRKLPVGDPSHLAARDDVIFRLCFAAMPTRATIAAEPVWRFFIESFSLS
jgi:hypothetical protein